MWAPFAVKVNIALAQMNVPPSTFDGIFRSGLQQAGKANGFSPQETAILLVSHGLGMKGPDDVKVAIKVWHQEKKIDISKPKITEAIQQMGYSVWGFVDQSGG